MPVKRGKRHEPEHRAYRHLVMALNVLVAHRNQLTAMPSNSWVVVQRIATANDAIETLRRAEHVLLGSFEEGVELQLELDIET